MTTFITMDWEIMTHLQYRPELTPSDFTCFDPSNNILVETNSQMMNNKLTNDVRRWLCS